MFSIAYVAVTVRARMAGLDPALEEAARDLGAGPSTTFFKVTLPLIMPGVLAGALLAFALSIDDYIITSFNSGSTLTFPLWVYGAPAQRRQRAAAGQRHGHADLRCSASWSRSSAAVSAGRKKA